MCITISGLSGQVGKFFPNRCGPGQLYHFATRCTLTVDDALGNVVRPDDVAAGSYPLDVQTLTPDDDGFVYGVPEVYGARLCVALPRRPDNLWVVGKTAGYDPLAVWITEAKARGLELHAWFNPYRARQSAAQSPLHASHLSQTRPAWVKPYGKQLWIDPGEPEAREQVEVGLCRAALAGPALTRACRETWTVPAPDKKTTTETRDFWLVAAPHTLDVQGGLSPEVRHRGLFKVNTYASQLTLEARWDALKAMVEKSRHGAKPQES